MSPDWNPPRFEPLPWVAGPDRMTVAAAFWPRQFPRLPQPEDRLIPVAPETRLLVRCHWQPVRSERPALLLVHGLEGSSESGYMLGTAERAWKAGFSVARMNQRNCGGTDHLTPTLYNSSLSGDVKAVLEHLVAAERLPEIFLAGFSLGGNLVMKMAGEMSDAAPGELKALAAISPALDLAACAGALERPRNWIYERYFVAQLKRRFHRKARLFPRLYAAGLARQVRTIREFDDRITAPHSGFRDAEDYYFRASALRTIGRVRRPALLLAAEDDPLVPFASLDRQEIRAQSFLRLSGTARGGHCGFLARQKGGERFWAERAIVGYFRSQSLLAAGLPETLTPSGAAV